MYIYIYIYEMFKILSNRIYIMIPDLLKKLIYYIFIIHKCYLCIKCGKKMNQHISSGLSLGRWDACVHIKSLQLCLTLHDPMDCRPPGSSVYRILQLRILSGLPCLLQGIFPIKTWDRTHVSYVSCISRSVHHH